MKNTLNAQTKFLIGSAALLLAGAAQAQVSIYGLVDLSYGKNELVSGKNSRADFHSGGDDGSSQGNSTSKLGVKGSTEVASGLKANVQFETAGITSDGGVGSKPSIDPVTGKLIPGTPFFNRQAWAGLSGAFGEVRLGKQDSVAFQTQVAFDFNGAANAASAFFNSGVSAGLPGRQDRSLQYIAPELNGFKTQLGFQPAGVASATGAKNTYSVGVTYTLNKLAVGFAGETKRTETTTSFKSLATSYDFGMIKAMASYADGGKKVDGGTGKGVGVGVVAPVGVYNVGLNYGKNSDTKVKAVEAFINREIFKNTTGYFDFGNQKTPGSATLNAYALGVIYAF